MKNHHTALVAYPANARYLLITLALVASIILPTPAMSALVNLATSPLATSTTSSVKPNLLFILDNSGSMDWDHMPDDLTDGGSDVPFTYGYYGIRSNQCNQIYYDPTYTYEPPIKADKTSYANSSFIAAWGNGIAVTGSVNLNTGFTANQSGIGGNAGGTDTATGAYYYQYTGTQNNQDQMNYHNTTSVFSNECKGAINTSPARDVFIKRRLSTTQTTTITVVQPASPTSTAVSSITVNGVELMSGPSAGSTTASTVATNIAAKITLNGFSATAAGSTVTITSSASNATYLASVKNFTPVITQTGNLILTPDPFPDTDPLKLTNFANWYSYYRTRMLMMKTATGHAFSGLNNTYRVGLMKISQTAPVIALDTFEGAQRTNWYTQLYGTTVSGSTPLRRSLSDAGRYFAGKLTGYAAGTTTDPIQYSCQQNFTILSTDGYWNAGDGYKLDGSTLMDNQDGDQPRPFYDGSTSTTQRFTSQLQRTQTQIRQSTSQIQKRVVTTQKSTSNLQQIIALQTRTSDLQSSTMYLQTRTSNDSGSTWSSWSSTTSCAWDTSGTSRRDCRYVTTLGGSTIWSSTTAVWTNVSSCTPGTAGTGTSGTWNGPITSCQYSAFTAWSSVTTCAAIAKDTTSPYTVPQARECQSNVTSNVSTCTTGTGITCQYTPFTAYSNADTCVAVPQDTTNPYDMTASGGVATQCQVTDTGFVAASSCTAGTSTGVVTTCQTINTGPTLVGSCTAASASAANNYTATTCSTTTLAAATPVETCTAGVGPSPDFIVTSCNTVTAGPFTDSCTASTATSANNWVTTSCVTSITSNASSNSLADVAMYYYKTDLRTPSLNNCTGAIGQAICGADEIVDGVNKGDPLNNVFTGDADDNSQQHMTTFTLGLGASGRMNYSTDYLTQTAGDFHSVKTGSTASATVCTWQATGTTCNWPIPGMSGTSGKIENIDDLWHTAVNGRGAYFAATNPATLTAGLTGALASVFAKKGAAAAAATSTLNPVAGNNSAYVASYTTVAWKGNLEARGINTVNGVVNENADWCVENVVADTCATAPVAETIGNTTSYYCVIPNAVTCSGIISGTSCKIPVAVNCTGTMISKVSAFSDTRKILTANGTGSALINFDAAYAAANPQYFSSAKLSALSQWGSLNATQQTTATGTNLVNYLRGQYGYEVRVDNGDANSLYRYREAILGDALESQPTFIAKPTFRYPYPGYLDYAAAQANRAGTVFMGTNDGMMHAFAASDGLERWAYVPSMVIPNMWKLADFLYSTLGGHANYVNGSPTTSDICISSCDTAAAVWKTILVAGLNAGGRGYFALDITVPNSPVLLWEFTTNEVGAIGKTKDDDLGYTFGQPIITRKADGTWVVLVTSGYNNVNPGSGRGYLYVLNAATGAIISKISTGTGDTTTPSGLAKISAFNLETVGNQAGFVYGGDLQGNVWRFDINSPVDATVGGGSGTGAVFKFATLLSPSGISQPITTTPVLGNVSGKNVVFIGTGKYLETSDLSNTQRQTQYAIKDDGATTTLLNARASLVQQTLSNTTSNTRSSSEAPVDFLSQRGWYFDFPATGERVNIDSQLVQGVLLIPSIVPSNTACTPGGFGWLNFVDYKTGTAVKTIAGIKSDSPIVGVNVLYIEGKPIVSLVTSNKPTPSQPPIQPDFFGSPSGFTGKRVIWRELIP